MNHLPLVFKSLISFILIEQASAALYENDFSTNGFTTENAGADWSVGSGTYDNDYSGDNQVSSSSVVVAGVAGTSFTMSTQFTVNDFGTGTIAPNNSTSTIGFGLLSSTANFSGTYYLADFGYSYASNFTPKGRLRILSLGNSSGYSYSESSGNFDGNTSTFAITEGTTYTLKLTGTYNESGHLDMTLGLFDSTGITQYGSYATGNDISPFTGTNFGYRNRTASQSSGDASLDANFDNFSIVTIPEPSTLILGSIFLVGLLSFRRRRH